MKKSDIENRGDIELLMDRFYSQLMVDPEIGFIFTDIAKIDLKKHLPILVDFWEAIIFQTGQYQGNPMQVHMALHQKQELTEDHFNRWMQLFKQTLDQLFEGDRTEMAKMRAFLIAGTMKTKLWKSRKT